MSRASGPRAVRLMHVGAVLLAVVAVVLASVAVAKATPDGPQLEAGSTTPMSSEFYGRSGAVLLPFSRVDVTVADPVESLDAGLVDRELDAPRSDGEGSVRAPDDGSLVPVSWSIRATTGLGADGDPEPITVVVARGDERIELTEVTLNSRSAIDVLDPEPVVVAFSGAVSSEPVRVEVTYAGATQTLDVASGEIDAGVAQPLYEADVASTTLGCAAVQDGCDFGSAEPDAAVLPYRAGFIAQGVSVFPYSAEEGWAEEGTQWASVHVQTLGSVGGYDATGRYWPGREYGPVRVTLDGQAPVRDGLGGGESATGSVLFAVDADDVESIEAVRIEQLVTLPAPAPIDALRLRADLPVRPR